MDCISMLPGGIEHAYGRLHLEHNGKQVKVPGKLL